MIQRSNEDWLTTLQKQGEGQSDALLDLREFLRRAVFVYLRDKRPDCSHFSFDDLHMFAEDFAQNAIVQIQQNLDTFKGQSKFTTWAYRFVINEAASELRRRHYRHISLEKIVEEGTAVLHNIASQPNLEPALKTEREDMMQKIIGILQEDLNQRQQQAILGVHLQGLSIQELAEKFETTPNTVYKILHDGRKKLKAALLAKHLSQGDILALFEDS